MKPVGWHVEIPRTKDDLVALQVELLNRSLQRTITQNDFALGNQAVRNLKDILGPAPAPIQDRETVIANFINMLPSELANAITSWIRKKAQEAVTT
jgi:hypothetical protein